MAALFDNAALFQKLLDNINDGVYFLDTDRKITYWNKGAERITGYPAEEVLGCSCADAILVHVDDAGQMLCHGHCPAAATMEDMEQRTAQVYLHHREGHRVPVRVSLSPIHDDTGNVIGAIEVFHEDTATMAALEEVRRLRRLSLIDPLTGVGNRRFTEDMLKQKLEEMRRSGRALGVLFFDVDHFKRFNDTFGHDVGDEVLTMVAKTLSSAMRSYDFLGRWGGEEFVGVVPNMDEAELVGTAERLRLLVERSSRSNEGRQLRVTVSMGAYLCGPADTAASALAAADRLMYESKQNGRNRVTYGHAQPASMPQAMNK